MRSKLKGATAPSMLAVSQAETEAVSTPCTVGDPRRLVPWGAGSGHPSVSGPSECQRPARVTAARRGARPHSDGCQALGWLPGTRTGTGWAVPGLSALPLLRVAQWSWNRVSTVFPIMPSRRRTGLGCIGIRTTVQGGDDRQPLGFDPTRQAVAAGQTIGEHDPPDIDNGCRAVSGLEEDAGKGDANGRTVVRRTDVCDRKRHESPECF